jgi:NAD(P)H-dependent FMN reductase
MKLEVIITSTRPGRIGDSIGKWIAEFAKKHSQFEISLTDLAELSLPIFDEPNHPRLAQYTKEHTKKWSKIIDAADAFIIVTPEYNFTMPSSLLNAVTFLSNEWKYKPIAFVGYGVNGAVRAIQTEKTLFVNFNAMPISPSVNLSGVFRPAVETFKSEEKHVQAAENMLTELHKWAEALLPLHKK